MAGISSLGVGSGLDLGGLVENLLNAERIPTQNSLDRQQQTLTTRLSGIGIFRGALSVFQSSLSGLEDPGNYKLRTFSNEKTSVMGVSVDDDAAVGSYRVDITNLAEKHSLASVAFASTDEVVGTGAIQIRFGTITGPGFSSFAPDSGSTTQTITIDSSNNTLDGIKNTINEGDYGVSAAIVNDGSGYRLTLESKNSGENAAMEITVTDTGDGVPTDEFGLSRLAYNASATQMTQTQAAEDATLLLNGLPITSRSNTLTETIEGVTLTLNEETDGTAFNLTVSENTRSISDSANKIVDAYNTMINSLNELAQAGEGVQSGVLVGDSALRTFVSSVRSQVTSAVQGLTGSVTALSTIGITTQVNGTLAVDSARLNAALANNPTGAKALFAPVGQIADTGIEMDAYTTSTAPGVYDINITQLATRSQLTGATGLGLPITIDANNDDISLRIDGVSTGALQLTAGSYTTGADLATEIQLQINSASAIKSAGASVSVSYDTVNNGFVITSNRYGSNSQVEITAIDSNTTAQLGLSVIAATAGVDVEGTIDGVTATGDGQRLTATAGDAEGLSLLVSGGVTGNRGEIRFTRGLVERLDALISSYIDSDGILSAKEDGINESLEQVQEGRDNLEVRLAALQARLIQQFSALDALVANFQTTGNFLAQQINSLPGAGVLLNDN
jgi:flagellar hook-associated protein 2